MSAVGFTPIQLYYSTTASQAPSAGNLANGELAINITDGKLFYKDNGGVVQVLATKGAGTIGGSNTQVQYNNAGALAGSANLTFDGTTFTANALTVSNAVTLSGGTANGVAYLNGSKVLTTGSALTFDGTNLTVGGSAIEKITTNGNIVGTAGQTYVYSNGGSGSAVNAGFLLSGTDNTVRFYAANSEQARLTSGGLVVGSTTVPTVGSTAMLAVGNTNGGTQAIVQSGSIVYRTSASTSGVDCFNPNASPISWYIAGANAMRLASTANLLVGTTLDNSWTLGGQARAFISRAGSAGALLALSDGVQQSLTFVSNAGAGSAGVLTINTANSGALAFSIGDVEKSRFNTSGDFLIGTTGSFTGQVGEKLVVHGPQTGGGGSVAYVYNTSASGADASPALNLYKAMTTTSSSARFMQFYAASAGTPMGGIVGNGASNVQFASLSDAREKTNITPINGSLAKIVALNPVEFDWISNGEHCKAGFVAQDVEQVFPEFVVENMANEGQEARKGLTGGMTGGIVAHLVKAIQEQQAIITQLKARLDAANL